MSETKKSPKTKPKASAPQPKNEGMEDKHPEAAPTVLRDPRDVARDKLNAEWEKESRMVRGVFRNIETPGLALKLTYVQYPQQKQTKWTLEDGVETEIPLFLVKHLNERCSYVKHKYAQHPDGSVHPTVGSRINRFQFQLTDYFAAA